MEEWEAEENCPGESGEGIEGIGDEADLLSLSLRWCFLDICVYETTKKQVKKAKKLRKAATIRSNFVDGGGFAGFGDLWG